MAARSLDIIVESHRLAQERRQQGKPVWDRTINIRAILQRDQSRDDDEYAVQVANEIGALLKQQLPAELLDVTREDTDWHLIEAVDALNDMTLAEFEDSDDRAVDELNGWLTDIYDWADLNRVWLGD